MKLLVVGGGGREHAIIKKLKENPSVTQIIAAPGNGGIAADAVCVPVGAKDIDGLVTLAQREQVDYAVVAPDDPLVLGAVDALTAAGIPCFGPNRAAAIIEGSKVFSKHLMKKYGIPTAAYETFDDMDAALAYLDTAPVPVVVKADGLALGKGVIIAQSREEAKEAVVSMMRDGRFGESGRHVVIEEFLTGPEVSVLSFTDGETLVPMVSSMDHKRALDGDEGLNTGGMGTIAPNPFYTDEIAAECMEKIFLPTIRAMRAEGRTFRGCLYFGLMLTPDGPKVIEYNCRRDAGGSPPARERPAYRHAGDDERHPEGYARTLQGWERVLLRRHGLAGLSAELRDRLPSHDGCRRRGAHIRRRREAARGWGARHLRRTRGGRHRRAADARAGRAGCL